MLDMISLVKCPCEYIDPVLLVEPHLGHENLGQVQSTERDQFSTRGKLHQSDRRRDSRCSDVMILYSHHKTAEVEGTVMLPSSPVNL